MTLIRNAPKHQANTSKQECKFHIEHTQNGATVQHTNMKQVIATICPKQQLGILQASKQYATVSQRNNKRHGHDVQVKHNKT